MDADGALVDRLRAGDELAFAALVRDYHPRLLRLADSMLPSRSVAEEVVQDTWLAVVRGVERFEGRSALKTWLFRILVNRARSAGGKEHRAGAFHDELDGDEAFDATGGWRTAPEPWTDRADARIDAADLADRVRELLPQLPESQRRVVLLRDVEGLDSATVATLLGLSDGNQRVLLHRGRQRLRQLLHEGLIDLYRRWQAG